MKNRIFWWYLTIWNLTFSPYHHFWWIWSSWRPKNENFHKKWRGNLKFNAASDSGLKNTIFSVFGVPFWNFRRAILSGAYGLLTTRVRSTGKKLVFKNAQKCAFKPLKHPCSFDRAYSQLSESLKKSKIRYFIAENRIFKIWSYGGKWPFLRSKMAILDLKNDHFHPYGQILKIRFSAIKNQILDFLSSFES